MEITDRRLAHTIALLTLPSSAWRLLVAAGFSLGYTEAGHRALVGGQPWALVALTAVVELAALVLTVRRPRLPRRLVVAAAAAGMVALALLWTPLLAWWSIDHPGMTAAGALWVGVLYLPLVAWAPLLGWLTVRYRRRTALTTGGAPPACRRPAWGSPRSAP